MIGENKAHVITNNNKYINIPFFQILPIYSIAEFAAKHFYIRLQKDDLMPDLSFGAIWTDTWRRFFKHFGIIAFFGILLVFIPMAIERYYSSLHPYPEFTDIASFLFALKQVLISSIIVSLFSLLFIVIVYTLLTKNEWSGKMFMQSLRMYPIALVLSLLTLLMLIPLFLLLIIPGVIFSIYWQFNVNALIYDKLSIWGAIKKSKKVVTDYWWITLGYGLLVWLIIILPSFILNIIFPNNVYFLFIVELFSAFAVMYFTVFRQSFYEALSSHRSFN